MKHSGKSSGAISIALFLLSMLLGVATIWWAYASAPTPQASYTFSIPTERAAIAERLNIKAWHALAPFSHELAQFETVFWEPEDTTSMRAWLESSENTTGSQVLEIGTGTGLIALWCLTQGATHVVATDINPYAVANAGYNAQLLGFTKQLDTRLVSFESPGPFSVIRPDEKFDLIVSNPPWEDASVEEVAAHALYDPGFAMLDSLLTEAADHLRPDGRMLLAYGAKTAIQRIVENAPLHGWQVLQVDDRKLDSLPEVFLPGLLLELTRDP